MDPSLTDYTPSLAHSPRGPQGPISYLGAKPPGTNGHMNLRLVRPQSTHSLVAHLEVLDEAGTEGGGGGERAGSPSGGGSAGNAGSGLDGRPRSGSLGGPVPVRYGDFDVKLDVVNTNRRLLLKKYTNYVTNFKKDVSKLLGGYLVCDGRGFPASFTLHHAPPQVEKLTIYRPVHPGSSLEGAAQSQRARQALRDAAAVKQGLPVAQALLVDNQAVQIHYDVAWGAGFQFHLDILTAPDSAAAKKAGSFSGERSGGEGGSTSRSGSMRRGGGDDDDDVDGDEGDDDDDDDAEAVKEVTAAAASRVLRAMSVVPLPLPLSPSSAPSIPTTPSGRKGSPMRSPGSTLGSSGGGVLSPAGSVAGVGVPRDPVVRLILSNGGRVTVHRDEIEAAVAAAGRRRAKAEEAGAASGGGGGAAAGDGFWVDLLDRDEEEALHQVRQGGVERGTLSAGH